MPKTSVISETGFNYIYTFPS